MEMQVLQMLVQIFTVLIYYRKSHAGAHRTFSSIYVPIRLELSIINQGFWYHDHIITVSFLCVLVYL
jgi:hypothetical protein